MKQNNVPWKKTLNSLLNYIPGLVILIFSMLALHSSLVLLQEHQYLQSIFQGLDHDSGVNTQAIFSTLEQRGSRLYWSVIVLGFSGFLLLILNAHKLWQIREDEQHKEDLQRQIHQAQKMEAVGRLAGGIAHDFNNILAAVNGYAEFLVDDLKDRPKQQKFAESILSAGRQATGLVDQMMTFSRRNSAEFVAMDVVVPLQDSVSMLSASLPKTIEMKSDVSLDRAIMQGNPIQISQVIMNLCVNAKDAMEDNHGCLSIGLKAVNARDYEGWDMVEDSLPVYGDLPAARIMGLGKNTTRLILSTMARGQDYLCLSIADSGSGIKRATMEHIFEPFFTTKSVDKGTGLGLSTVHGIILSHQGAMIIDSTVGEGTSFYLFFPMAHSDVESEHSDVAEGQGALQGRVLLAEDQEEVRDMMVARLARLGLEVECAENGVEALAILQENPTHFDLVITDQNMPKMTGLELAEQASKELPDLPFVLVSGYSKNKLRDFKNKQSSIKAILRKPISSKALEKEIRLVLQGDQAVG